MNNRIHRELKTVRIMIEMHCRSVHGTKNGRCTSCHDLAAYARNRTETCRFGESKPVCSACPVHCYKRDHRNQIQEVMRFAGPRMMVHHPVLAIMHIIDKWKKFQTEL